jgi:hypothetical protein
VNPEGWGGPGSSELNSLKHEGARCPKSGFSDLGDHEPAHWGFDSITAGLPIPLALPKASGPAAGGCRELRSFGAPYL